MRSRLKTDAQPIDSESILQVFGNLEDLKNNESFAADYRWFKSFIYIWAITLK
jgi:hypothetical protein